MHFWLRKYHCTYINVCTYKWRKPSKVFISAKRGSTSLSRYSFSYFECTFISKCCWVSPGETDDFYNFLVHVWLDAGVWKTVDVICSCGVVVSICLSCVGEWWSSWQTTVSLSGTCFGPTTKETPWFLMPTLVIQQFGWMILKTSDKDSNLKCWYITCSFSFLNLKYCACLHLSYS